MCDARHSGQQRPDRRLDLQDGLGAERGHEGHIARKLNGVAQGLVGMEQDGLACERLVTKPEGLRESPVCEAERRCLPARFASRQASLEISGQHLQQREIPDRIGIAGLDRQRLAKGRKGLVQPLHAPQRPRLLVECSGKIRTKRESAVEAREGLLHPAKSRMKRAEILVCLGLAGVQRNRPLEIGLSFREPAEPLEAKAARLIQRGDIRIEPGEYVEAFQGFGIPALTEQPLALLRGLKTLLRGRQILRRDLWGLFACGPAFLTVHRLTRKWMT